MNVRPHAIHIETYVSGFTVLGLRFNIIIYGAKVAAGTATWAFSKRVGSL
jgi:hypothetical protein